MSRFSHGGCCPCICRCLKINRVNTMEYELKAFRWNVEAVPAFTLEDETLVSPTSYMEVFELIGTSGCSNTPEMWTWSVMGVLETSRGNIVVNPGDWVVELLKDLYVVMTDEEYVTLAPFMDKRVSH